MRDEISSIRTDKGGVPVLPERFGTEHQLCSAMRGGGEVCNLFYPGGRKKKVHEIALLPEGRGKVRHAGNAGTGKQKIKCPGGRKHKKSGFQEGTPIFFYERDIAKVRR